MKNDIEALRGFANEAIYHSSRNYNAMDEFSIRSHIKDSAVKFNLIDEKYNKTELLTGSKKKRSKPFHDKYMSLIRFAFEHWDIDEFKDFDEFRKDIIILAGYYTKSYDLQGNIKLIAKSMAFDKMDLSDFERLYSNSIDVILKHVLTNYTKADLERCVSEVLRYS